MVISLYLVLLLSIMASYNYIHYVHYIFHSHLNAEDHFDPIFTKCIKSEYRKETSFITDLHQDQALMKCGDVDLERWYLEMDNSVPLHPHNPCDFDGIVLSGVEIWGKVQLLSYSSRVVLSMTYKFQMLFCSVFHFIFLFL